MGAVSTFGEILLRLSTESNKLLGQSERLELHYGGSEANVAVSLSKMGLDARMISKLPDNELTDHALSTFRQHGVDTRYVFRGAGRFGLYFLEQGSALRGSKVIYDREESSFARMDVQDYNWSEALGGSDWLHISGISAAVSEPAARVCLKVIQVARSLGMTISMDLNYRKNLWRYGKKPSEVMPDLVRYVDVLLGDPATANTMLGTNIPTKDYYASADDLKESYAALQQDFPNLKYMGMTLREVKSANHNLVGGAVYFDGQMYGAQPVEVTPIVERIGGGDAFMAGLIYGLIHQKDLAYTVNFATMASVLKMTVAGDFSLFTKEDIESYMGGDNLGKIQR